MATKKNASLISTRRVKSTWGLIFPTLAFWLHQLSIWPGCYKMSCSTQLNIKCILLKDVKHARILEFSSGGGVQVSLTKKSSDNVFFLVLSLFYRSQMVNFKEIYHFTRFQRGSNIFQGRSNFFQGGGGVQLPIPYRNPYNL